MLSDKELKKSLISEFQKSPEKYYPSLSELGFVRKKCSCGKFFWSSSSDKCGSCSRYGFIGKTPAKKKLSYMEVWRSFSNLMKKQGYTPIKRYPTVARWRDDIEFVEASIDDFIPFVIRGETAPPANPLVVPQPCLRFNDIDNVGITGAHYSCFVMIGQHRFESPEKYDMNAYFNDLMKWFTKGMKIPISDMVIHEDVWAGSGNFGPCMEFFSRGIELANQVYMQFAQPRAELPVKVLDMGLGHERNAWFSAGADNSYETTFPTICKRLRKKSGLNPDRQIMKSFLPLSSQLNIDELENAEKTWSDIAGKIGVPVGELKNNVIPLSALYSIIEHSRTLLVGITDGKLPSNVGGGYNLRVLLRRALSFIEKYGWDIDLMKLCEMHASYLKPLFPELRDLLGEINDIIEVEKKRYSETKKNTGLIVKKIVGKEITEGELLKLYDSHGILPELVKEEYEKAGKKINIPENFYAKVAELHETEVKKEPETRITGVPATRLIFYEDQNKKDFTAKVLKVTGNKVVLDQTCFYARSGGQEPDHGFINGCKVYDVEKFGNIIVHSIEGINFKEGDIVSGSVDWPRRMQLTVHHTATHLVNAAARKVLGKHIWQHSAFKDVEKARLDITHYKPLSGKELEKIEKVANKYVARSADVKKLFMPRNIAEKKFGFRIYQGGAVPEKVLRIIKTPMDVEACGGLHCDNTKEVGNIMITRSDRIQDGIIRLEFTAGEATTREKDKQKKILLEAARILDVSEPYLVEKTKELFEEWKSLRKGVELKSAENAEKLSKGFGKERIVVEILPATANDLKKITRNVKSGQIMVLFGSKDRSIVVTSGKDTKIDSGDVMRKLAAEHGGKGGGSVSFAQGIYSKEPDTAKIKKMLEAML